MFAVIFVSISFIDFIYQQPEVEYYKSNDNKTNKTFLISDSFLMFRPFFYCYSNYSQSEKIHTFLSSREKINKMLKYDLCSLGENINLKYKD